MNAMAIHYDPKSHNYKNDLISNFMNFIEKFINRIEKVEKINDKMTCISANKSPNMLILVCDFKVIVHCQSIHLIILSAPWVC